MEHDVNHELSWPSPHIVQAGVSQKELCDLLGLNYKAEALNAKLLGLTTHGYLQQITGWTLYRERYYPTTPTLPSDTNAT